MWRLLVAGLSLAVLSTAYSSSSLSSSSSSICDAYITTITNQSQIDALSRCGTIDGSIIVSRNFTGAFVLPNVTSLRIVYIGNPVDTYEGNPPVRFTSVSLPDLVTLTQGVEAMQIDLRNISISMPKLQSADSIIFEEIPYNVNISFPALESIRSGSKFDGAIDSISLPALTQAGSISVSSYGNIDCIQFAHQLSNITWAANSSLSCWSLTSQYDDPDNRASFPSGISTAIIPNFTTPPNPSSSTGSSSTVSASTTATQTQGVANTPSVAARSGMKVPLWQVGCGLVMVLLGSLLVQK